jgi:hypothetical protein
MFCETGARQTNPSPPNKQISILLLPAVRLKTYIPTVFPKAGAGAKAPVETVAKTVRRRAKRAEIRAMVIYRLKE